MRSTGVLHSVTFTAAFTLTVAVSMEAVKRCQPEAVPGTTVSLRPHPRRHLPRHLGGRDLQQDQRLLLLQRGGVDHLRGVGAPAEDHEPGGLGPQRLAPPSPTNKYGTSTTHKYGTTTSKSAKKM